MASIEDELLALESEFKESAAAAPKVVASSAPVVISSAPVKNAPAASLPPALLQGGKRVPVSEWASPSAIRENLAHEGMVVPVATDPANAPPASMPAASRSIPVAPYISATTFSGPKEGYVFKNGNLGLGYYAESAHGLVSAAHGNFLPPAPPAHYPKPAAVAPAASSSSSSRPAERNISRTVAGQVWKDKTLLDWPEDDFRVFVGDLGNEVNDDVLSHAFQKYPSFQMARVVRDRNSSKTKGYGFVSFKDPWDMTKALREMQGKYVGNRPIKLRKSSATDRAVTDTNQPLHFEHALAVANKGVKRQLEKGGAVHKAPTWGEGKKSKKKHLPW